MASDRKRTCGIYAIEQVGTGRLYIGSSINIPSRWYEHRRLLEAGRHHSPFLQKAWAKHGAAAFRFSVLEDCERDKTALLSREQEYLNTFEPIFNVCPTAGSTLGRPITDAELANRRRANRERSIKITHCPKGHAYDDANTGRNTKGKRYCRACAADRMRAKLAIETSEQRSVRLTRATAYYERTKDMTAEQRWAYTLAHKDEKREYDRAHRESFNERGRTRRASETPDQRAHRLAQKTADYERHKAERLAHQNETYRRTHPIPEPATACKNGHPYTDSSFRMWRGKKLCKVCRATTKRQYRERQRALGKAA